MNCPYRGLSLCSKKATFLASNMFPSKPSKYFLEQELIKKLEAYQGTPIRILEIGSGTCEIARNLLEKFPNLTNVGIEPDAASVTTSKQSLAAFTNATILHGLGYGDLKHASLESPFDLVFSLSVLEHVKQLEKFLAYSIRITKQGGEVVHLYDLGHSLYPGSWKESLQTKLCASPLLRFMPEHKVARYLATGDVEKLLQKLGCSIGKITFHNMPDLVRLLKNNLTEDMLKHIVAFESTNFEKVTSISKREKLFPSICFWCVKS